MDMSDVTVHYQHHNTDTSSFNYLIILDTSYTCHQPHRVSFFRILPSHVFRRPTRGISGYSAGNAATKSCFLKNCLVQKLEAL